MPTLAPILFIALIAACLLLSAQTSERRLTDRLLDMTEGRPASGGPSMTWLGVLVLVAAAVLAFKLGILPGGLVR